MTQRFALFPAVALLCQKYRIEPQQRVTTLNGSAIIVANHASHFDTLLLLRALPAHVRRRTVVAAAADYFYTNPLKGSAVSLALNTFPFDRKDGEASLERCMELVRDGWTLLIYPEGTRSTDGSIGRFKRGVGTLAAALGVPVVPVYIEGASTLMSKGRSLPHRASINVRFGAPRRFRHDDDPIAIANDLRDRVYALARGGPTSPAPARSPRPLQHEFLPSPDSN
jgi:1-acyl-sn-glycerol-3-phosphate acyltransferase